MSNSKDSLGNRMKTYENVSRIYLTRRTPVIIRIDGKTFHTFTKGLKKPFDEILIQTMQNTTRYLCEHIQGCKLAYTQSDEISLLLIDYDTIDTCAWFDNNLQKIVSVAASMATMAFNCFMQQQFQLLEKPEDTTVQSDYDDYYWTIYDKQCFLAGAMFDARAFILPKDEICNYFIWRQQDCTRNSIEMVGMSYFSDKELFKKNCSDIQDMLHEQKNVNWNDFPTYQKRGSCIVKDAKWAVDKDIPIFTQDRNYIEKYVFPEKVNGKINENK